MSASVPSVTGDAPSRTDSQAATAPAHSAAAASANAVELLPAHLEPLQQAAHPDEPCRSISCVRAHCQKLMEQGAAASAAAAAASAADVVVVAASLSLEDGDSSAYSGSPSSTRSGTSPGYANDWSLRKEPLAVRADQPDKTRRDRPVRKLAPVMSLAQRKEAKKKEGDTEAAQVARPIPTATEGALPLQPSTAPTSSLLQRRQQLRAQAAAEATSSSRPDDR